MTKKEIDLDRSRKVHCVNYVMKQFIELQTYAAYDKIPFDYRSMMALQLTFLPEVIDLTNEAFHERLAAVQSQLTALEKLLQDAKLGRWG